MYVALSILSGALGYLFSDMFCVIDEVDSVTGDKKRQRVGLGVISLLVTMILSVNNVGIVLTFGMAVVLRQAYEDSLCNQCYELPLFLVSLATVIKLLIEENTSVVYVVLVALIIVLGTTKMFGMADTYSYMVALALMSSNDIYVIAVLLVSSIITIVVSIYKARRDKIKLTKVKVAQLPIIVSTAIVFYNLVLLTGLKDVALHKIW
jgi:hypothetical protein